MAATAKATVQVYSVFIKASPQSIWDAITSPEWTPRYGYGGTAQFDLRPGGQFKSVVNAGPQGTLTMADGEVLEAEKPARLAQTWRLLMDPQIAAEGFTRLVYEIQPARSIDPASGKLAEIPGVTRVTVTHNLHKAPRLAAMVSGEIPEAGGGWTYILSDLKSLLETGKSLREAA